MLGKLYTPPSLCESLLTCTRILQASRVPEHAVMANRTMVRQGLIEPVQVQRALTHRVSSSLPNEMSADSCRGSQIKAHQY